MDEVDGAHELLKEEARYVFSEALDSLHIVEKFPILQENTDHIPDRLLRHIISVLSDEFDACPFNRQHRGVTQIL